MTRLREFFSKPFGQSILILGGAFLLYLIISRPVESVNDFAISGNLAYIASGTEGIRVVDLTDPKNLKEVGHFRCAPPIFNPFDPDFRILNCANSARSIEIQDNYIYLADGNGGLWMFDVSTDPLKPIKVAQLSLPGKANDVVVVGEYAYVAAGKGGIRVVHINQKSNGKSSESNKKSAVLEDLNNSAIEGNAVKIFHDGNYLYWLDNRNTLHFLSIKKPDKPQDVGLQKYKYPINDIVFRGNYAYFAASDQGLQVMDKSDLPNLPQVSQLNLNGKAQGIYLYGDYAYLTVKGVGLAIVDITDIEQPEIVQDTYAISGNLTKILLQDNVAYIANGVDGLYSLDAKVIITTEIQGQTGEQMIARHVAKAGNYLYVAAEERGLRVLDVSNLTTPREVAFVDTNGRADSVAIGGDVAYVADRTNGLVLVDVTTRAGELPILLTIASKDARDVALDPNLSYAYIADSSEGFKIIDISKPKSAFLVKTMGPVNGQTITPISVTVFDNYAYLANTDQGVRIINIVDKNIPTQVQQLLIPGQADARNVAVVAYNPQWAQTQGQDPYNPPLNDPGTRVYIYVANGQYGLQIFDITNPANPVQVNVNDQIKTLPGIAMDVSINGNRAYLAYDGGGVIILDTTNPADPQVVGISTNLQADNRAVDLDVEGSTVYLAMLDHGVSTINTANTANPVVLSQYDAPTGIKDMFVQGDYAYTVDGSRGLWTFDISDTGHPQEVSFLSIPQASGVFVAGDYAFVAAGQSGLLVVNILDKKTPQVIAGIPTAGYANDVVVAVRPDSNPPIFVAYIADSASGLFVVNVTNPYKPTRIGSISGIGNALKLTYNHKDYVFVSAEQDGLVAVNVVDPANPVRMDSVLTPPLTRNSAIVSDQYAYVATSSSGMPILDVSYPLNITVLADKAPAGAQQIEDIASPIASSTVITTTSIITGTQPISPTQTISATISILEPGIIRPNYSFLADRTYGMEILETTNPVDPQPRGSWKAANDTEGNLSTPQIIQVIPEWLQPQNNKPGTFNIFVADAVRGMTILSGTKETDIKALDVFITDGMPTLTAFKIYLKGKNQADPKLYLKAALTIKQLSLDIILFGLVGAFCWIGFLALFIIPLSKYNDWENIFSRLMLYMFNRQGPVIRVKEGKVIQYPGEEVRPGPGLLLVDSSSAVVLEKRNTTGTDPNSLPLARVVSSGYFMTGNRVYLSGLRFNEIVRGVADLRPQVRIATGVTGYSRDGIEFETVIFSIFTLGERPDIVRVAYANPANVDSEIQAKGIVPEAKDLQAIEIRKNHRGNWIIGKFSDELDGDDQLEIQQFILSLPEMRSLDEIEEIKQESIKTNGVPYFVDPVRIFQAIFAKTVDIPENKELDWTDLPNNVVIEIFRNLLAGEIYDKLYEPLLDTQPPILGLKRLLRLKMRNQGILSYHFIRRVDNKPFVEGQEIPYKEIISTEIRALSSANASKILRSRGIKVMFGGFSELRPTEPAVRERFVDNWQAKWDRESDIVLGNYEMQALRRRNRWRLSAQRAFIDVLTNILDQNPNADEALAMQVLQALEALSADPDTKQLLPKETIDMLGHLRNWLLHS